MSGPKRPSTNEVFLAGLKAHGSPLEYFVFKYRRRLGLAFFLVALLGTCVATWPPPAVREAQQSSGVQSAHGIGVALYSYAQDHGGKYPDGKSSTEVFQKLMDGGYVTDPTIFFLPGVSGKTKGTGTVLKPENVCWDFTKGTRPDDTSGVALVFSTGTQMDYTRGKKARVFKDAPFESEGVAVFFSNEAAAFIPVQDGEARIHSEDYDPKGQPYLQLTP